MQQFEDNSLAALSAAVELADNNADVLATKNEIDHLKVLDAQIETNKKDLNENSKAILSLAQKLTPAPDASLSQKDPYFKKKSYTKKVKEITTDANGNRVVRYFGDYAPRDYYHPAEARGNYYYPGNSNRYKVNRDKIHHEKTDYFDGYDHHRTNDHDELHHSTHGYDDPLHHARDDQHHELHHGFDEHDNGTFRSR